MTKIEECAVEYVRLANEAARLKTAAINAKCKFVEYPDRGEPQCWASYDARGNHVPLSEYCEACKGRMILREQRRVIVKLRRNALLRLKRLCKEPKE